MQTIIRFEEAVGGGWGLEHRAYKSWADARRAATQIRKQRLTRNVVTYLDVRGPALHIVRSTPCPGCGGPSGNPCEACGYMTTPVVQRPS